MDEELKLFLTQISDHLKGRLDAMDARLEGMDGRLDAMKAGLEKMETTLLTEFHKWASPVETRARGSREIVHALELELDLLKDRVQKLEGAKL
jgi:hypothetical protein